MKQSNQRLKNSIAPQIVPWKQALVNAMGVYPLLFFYEWLVKQLLPVHLIDRQIILLIVVLMIATSMVFIVMPLLVKTLGPWLFKKQ
jgi:antibiotic biosynthesis monooxygenase (ABM) superfamily enzyme